MSLAISSTVDYLKTEKLMDPGTTRKKIEEIYSQEANNNNIQTELVKLSLVCPITKTRIQVPIRGTRCKHLQCFDAEAHLGLAKNRPSYRRPTCPICSVDVPINALVVDGYLLAVLESNLLKPTTTEIELLEDGNWRPAKDNSERPSGIPCIDLTEDSEPETDPSPEKPSSTKSIPVANKPVPANPIPANPSSHHEERQIPPSHGSQGSGNGLPEGFIVGPVQSSLDDQVRSFASMNWVPYSCQHNHEGPSRQGPQVRCHEAFQNPYRRLQPARPPRKYISIPKSPYMIFVRGFPDNFSRRDMFHFMTRFGFITFFCVVPEVKEFYCEFYEFRKTFWIISELNQIWFHNYKLTAGISYAPYKTFVSALV